jgi:endonuclease/exonuclease/phosphatase family metal-dependent hydrolase
MRKITVCAFNVENLYGRYKAFEYLPGDKFKRRILTEEDLLEKGGFHPGELSSRKAFSVFDKEAWRTATAKALKGGTDDFPDIAVLEEVEDMRVLRKFASDYLGDAYPFSLLIDSHDPRLIDIGILSKHRIVDVRTHMDESYDDKSGYLFSRDCVEATFRIGDTDFTVFANHLKSKLADTPEALLAASAKREAQAKRVADIVRERFGQNPDDARFMVAGDFNDTPDSRHLEPLTKGLGLENVINRIPDPRERWTHLWKAKYTISQIDYILLPKALAEASPAAPRIERRGVSKKCKTVHYEPGQGVPPEERIALDFERFPEVTDKIEASDHCPVFMELMI